MKCENCKHWEQYNAKWGDCEKLPSKIKNPATLRFDSSEVHSDFFCGFYRPGVTNDILTVEKKG